MTASPIRLLPQAQEDLWFAIKTRYRFETKVAARLQTKGVETFLPLLEETHCWSDRKKTISRPLFSGYVFVRLRPSSASRLNVLRTEGVIGFVSFHGNTPSIQSKQMEDLQMLLSQRAPCSRHAFLQAGQRVRIKGGCLDGLEGILARSDQQTVVISIECIQRSVAFKIEGYDLEVV
jgi:transcription antitermination factor NusG